MILIISSTFGSSVLITAPVMLSTTRASIFIELIGCTKLLNQEQRLHSKTHKGVYGKRGKLTNFVEIYLHLLDRSHKTFISCSKPVPAGLHLLVLIITSIHVLVF